MISAEAIAQAKTETIYTDEEPFHEHDDCIRIAYQWLDAQTRTKGRLKHYRPIKHIVEGWAGRYVSRSDVEVAAHMHPDIRGSYPYFNISARFTEPNQARLGDIGEAKTQRYKTNELDKTYSSKEPEPTPLST